MNFTKITSGRINSQNKVNVKISNDVNNPTVVESRIKLPKTYKGLWPAFWMLGAEFNGDNWPACGEIDIMEMGNADGIKSGLEYSKKYMTVALHVLNNNGGESSVPVVDDPDFPGFYDKIDLQDGKYHTFKVKYWQHEAVDSYGWVNRITYEFYIDNVLVKSLHPSDEIVKNSNVFNSLNKDFFILFNLAVGGTYTGILEESFNSKSIIDLFLNGSNSVLDKITALNNGNNYAAKMYVDWVKVSGGGNNWEDNCNDLSNWNIDEGTGKNNDGWGNREFQEYTRNNVSIEYDTEAASNCLVITARLE
ncbi:MAG: family 16 glycosylhydrolase [Elusimicrobiota bacterium]|nr:family 16 glycosylhydrolase [Elusimicrobiota bacterium]